jgi:hypothetical protein
MVMTTANAGSVAGNDGATEVTQLLNNVELIQQSAQMYQQVLQTLYQVQMMHGVLIPSPLTPSEMPLAWSRAGVSPTRFATSSY